MYRLTIVAIAAALLGLVAPLAADAANYPTNGVYRVRWCDDATVAKAEVYVHTSDMTWGQWFHDFVGVPDRVIHVTLRTKNADVLKEELLTITPAEDTDGRAVDVQVGGETRRGLLSASGSRLDIVMAKEIGGYRPLTFGDTDTKRLLLVWDRAFAPAATSAPAPAPAPPPAKSADAPPVAVAVE